MATINLKFVVTLPSTTSDADESENVFYWQHDTPFTVVYADLVTDLVAFYNSGTHKLSDYIGSIIDRSTGACTISIYDVTAHLSGTPAGSPVFVATFTLGAPRDGTGYALQIAALGEFRADYGSSVEFGTHARPRARKRSRHWVGPLVGDAIDNGPQPNVTANLVSGLNSAMGALMNSTNFGTNAGANPGQGWSVWSRVDAAMYPVLHASTDLTPRTRRRRVIPLGKVTAF